MCVCTYEVVCETWLSVECTDTHSHTGASLCEIQVQDGSTIDLENNGDVCYSLWVSFAEIYNEFIYDLLAEEPDKTRRGRPPLRLAEDRNHNHFIKGVCVCVCRCVC